MGVLIFPTLESGFSSAPSSSIILTEVLYAAVTSKPPGPFLFPQNSTNPLVFIFCLDPLLVLPFLLGSVLCFLHLSVLGRRHKS